MYCCKNTNDDENDNDKTYKNIILENQKLKLENIRLKNDITRIENSWIEDIDKFVDEWYEENKDTVDIGVLNFKFFKIDLFPDYLEKHIYKKMIKILFSFFRVAITPKNN